MGKKNVDSLSRRERQIMDILFSRGQASAAQVLQAMHDPPSYSAVRAMLRVLEEKGHVKHQLEGLRYIYQPTQSKSHARETALNRVLHTFFGGSTEQAVAALLDLKSKTLSTDEYERLRSLIEEARKEGR